MEFMEGCEGVCSEEGGCACGKENRTPEKAAPPCAGVAPCGVGLVRKSWSERAGHQTLAYGHSKGQPFFWPRIPPEDITYDG